MVLNGKVIQSHLSEFLWHGIVLEIIFLNRTLKGRTLKHRGAPCFQLVKYMPVVSGVLCQLTSRCPQGTILRVYAVALITQNGSVSSVDIFQ